MFNEKLSILGRAVRCLVDGHLATVFLTDYDQETDTYWGEAHRNRSMNTRENPPVVSSVRGLRQFPYEANPYKDFQFVFPGEDEQPLLDIYNHNHPEGNVTHVSNLSGGSKASKKPSKG